MKWSPTVSDFNWAPVSAHVIVHFNVQRNKDRKSLERDSKRDEMF